MHGDELDALLTDISTNHLQSIESELYLSHRK